MTKDPARPERACKYVAPPAFILFFLGNVSGVLLALVLNDAFGMNWRTIGLVLIALIASFFLSIAQSVNEQNREALASHHAPPCGSTSTDHAKNGTRA